MVGNGKTVYGVCLGLSLVPSGKRIQASTISAATQTAGQSVDDRPVGASVFIIINAVCRF